MYIIDHRCPESGFVAQHSASVGMVLLLLTRNLILSLKFSRPRQAMREPKTTLHLRHDWTQKQVVITQEIVEGLSKQPEWEKELEEKCGAHLPSCHA